MNRAERRRNRVAEPPKTYTLNADHVAAIKEQAQAEAIEVAFTLMIGMPSLVLHDKWGWGEKRLGRLMDQMSVLFEDFQEGRLTLADIHKALKEETGLEIVKT